jgi:Protein of unknown function (DUF2752)
MSAINMVAHFMIDRADAVFGGRGRGLCIGALATAALAYVAVVDPHRPGALLPPCPTKLLTGLDCPACGGLRLTHDLLHVNLSAAVQDNLFLLLSIPGLAVVSWRSWRKGGKVGAVEIPKRAAIGIAGIALAWMVVRNLPGWPLKPTVTLLSA